MRNYGSLSDAELVSLLKNGDQAAYTEIYKRYHAALYIHVYNKIRNREESRDLVHDLFSSIWQRHRELELKTTLATYLYAAIRYKVFELIARKEKASDYLKSISDFAEQQHCLTDHLIREKQLNELIEKEIAALPAKMREVFELSRKENLSNREIAARLGISEMTVKKQVNNSLKVLRSKLGSTLFVAFIL